MVRSKLEEQVLKAIFRKIGHFSTKNASVMDVKAGFDNVDREEFIAAVQKLAADGLLFDRGHGYVALSADGWDIASQMINPPPVSNTNNLNIGEATNSPIQQGIHSQQTQTTNYEQPSSDDLRKLVDLMMEHLGELKLAPEQERKAFAQLKTMDAQLTDEPNPTIIAEAGRTLKNVTEGAIGSLLAAAAQPGVWSTVSEIMAML